MHEMGVVLNIVNSAEQVAKTNNAQRVVCLVLQIGELSGVMPRFVEMCWPAAIQDTLLATSKLVIEEIPGDVTCKTCGKAYNLLKHESICPACAAKEWDILSGRDVMIKEIAVE